MKNRLAATLCLLVLVSAAARSQDAAPAPPEFPAATPTRLSTAGLPPFPPVVKAEGARPWSAHLSEGWNLLAFPGLVQTPLGGLQYALIDASSGSQLNGSPQPWRAYWAYSDHEITVSTALAPAVAPPELTLQPGWNALASPLRAPTSVNQVETGEGGGAATYSQCYSGELGNFRALPFQTGFTFQPSQVVWVYANRACSVLLGDGQPGALASGGLWSVQGRAVDERGQAITQGKISLKSDYGRQSLQADSWGRFMGQLQSVPAQIKETTVQLRIQANYFDTWKKQLTLPLREPVVAKLTRKTSTLSISMYPYKWGNAEYRPSSVLIYEYGNYHKRFSQNFYYNYGGRCDATIKYFPQGRPYRMTAVWTDHKGYQHSLTRDGTVTQAWQTFTLWNSWSSY